MRITLAIGAAAAAMAVAVVAHAVGPDDHRPLTAVPLPAAGEVTMTVLDDGTFVGVVAHTAADSQHAEAGDALGPVSVVDLESPHLGNEVAWCPGARIFLDVAHGSMFQPDGRYMGGPAGHGLVGRAVVDVADDQVLIGGRLEPEPRTAPWRTQLAGPPCAIDEVVRIDGPPTAVADLARAGSAVARIDGAQVLDLAGGRTVICPPGAVELVDDPTGGWSIAEDLRDVPTGCEPHLDSVVAGGWGGGRGVLEPARLVVSVRSGRVVAMARGRTDAEDPVEAWGRGAVVEFVPPAPPSQRWTDLAVTVVDVDERAMSLTTDEGRVLAVGDDAGFSVDVGEDWSVNPVRDLGGLAALIERDGPVDLSASVDDDGVVRHASVD